MALDTLLILLGVLGFGAVMVALHIFVGGGAARGEDGFAVDSLVERRGEQRRRAEPVTFPLEINGEVIASDRRILSDRRLQAA